MDLIALSGFNSLEPILDFLEFLVKDFYKVKPLSLISKDVKSRLAKRIKA